MDQADVRIQSPAQQLVIRPGDAISGRQCYRRLGILKRNSIRRNTRTVIQIELNLISLGSKDRDSSGLCSGFPRATPKGTIAVRVGKYYLASL